MYLGALSRVSSFATLPIRSIPSATVHVSVDYIEVTLVTLPRISRGYFAGVILWVSYPGWGRTAQSLYALKLRATIIGYIPLLVVYGSLKPLLGKTYLLHSGAHLSSPCFLAFGFRFFSDCSMHDSWPRVYVNRESFLFFESLWIQVWLCAILIF